MGFQFLQRRCSVLTSLGSSSLFRVLCLLGVSRTRQAGLLARDPRGRKCRKGTGGRDLRNVQCSNGRESWSKGFQPRIDRQGSRGPRPLDGPWRLQDWPTASLLRRDGLHGSNSTGDETFHVNHGQTRTSHSLLHLSMSAQFVGRHPIFATTLRPKPIDSLMKRFV